MERRVDRTTPRARRGAGLLLVSGLLLLGACRAVPPVPPDPHEGEPGELERAAVGDEIVVCGKRYHTGAPVVPWFEPGGYDAYDTAIRPGTAPEYADPVTGRRYEPGRRERSGERRQLVAPNEVDPLALARVVDQFVVHYDVCGTSRTCFEVLQHGRGLSVHFLLDVDGTIYQTLDVRETGWHATKANPRSIGVEIAQMGAWPPGETSVLESWYSTDERGPLVDLPERLHGGGVRTEGFVGRPARAELQEGVINGRRLVQYDFTPEQYDSLARLIAALSRALPRLEVEVPRDRGGAVRDGVLAEDEYRSFSGILGHCHVQANKADPGPAFDWERLLRDVRRYR